METGKAERSESFGVPAPIPMVYSWGRSDFGNLFRKPGDDHIDGVYQFHSPRTIMQVSSNIYHSAAVTSTGELYTCGENYDGQVSPKCSSAANEEEECKRPRILDMLGGQQRVTAVSCGLTHTVCVTASGCAVSFGGNESGQLGHTPNTISNVPPKIVQFNTHGHTSGSAGTSGGLVIKKAVAGDLFSLFLTTSGEVYGCGSPSYLGNVLPISEANTNITTAQRVETLIGTHVTELVAGSAHVLILTGSGVVYGWGDNAHFQLGFSCTGKQDAGNTQSTETHQQVPRRVECLGTEGGRIVGLSAGYHHSVAWTDQGILFGTGANKYGQLALPVPRAEAFEQIPLPHPCMQAACGSNHTLVLCKTTTTSDLPLASAGLLGPPPLPAPEVSASGTVLYGFGANNNGQITAAHPGSMFRTPQLLTTITSAYSVNKLVYIAAGGDQSFAIGVPGAMETSGMPMPGGLLRKQFSTLVSKATVAMSSTQLLSLLQTAKAAVFGPDGKPQVMGGGDQQQVGLALNTASEIFSTPALLAGSFLCTADSEQGQQQRTIVEEALQALQYRLLRRQYPDEYPKLPSFDGVAGYDHTNIYAHSPETAARVAALTLPDSEYLVTPPYLDLTGIEQCYVTLMQLGSTATARLLAAVQQSITELEYATASIPAGSVLPESALRVLLILWQAPIMAVPTLSNHIFARLLKIVRPLHKKLKIMCAMYPKHILVSRLLKPLQAHLAYAVQFDNNRVLDTNDTPLLCEALGWLHSANETYHFAEPEAFYNERVAAMPDTTLVSDCFNWRKHRELAQKNSHCTSAGTASSTTGTATNNATASNSHSGTAGANNSSSGGKSDSKEPFFLSSYAFLIPVETKRRLILIEDHILMQHYQQEALRMALLAGANTVMPFFILPIERPHLLQQSLIHISSASPLELRKPLKVVFIGEEGIDEGGVKKEFFQLLITQLFAPQYGMFVPAPSGRASVINMCNTYADAEFRLVGVLLGLAVYNNVILDVHFPLVLYKLLLQQRVNLQDLQAVDPELHRGLVQMLQFEPAEQVEDVFCRTFVTEWEEFGAKKEYELINDGKNVPVTGSNRYTYVDKLVQWMLKDSIRPQFVSLLEGFHSVVSPESLLLLTAEELQSVMVGTPHLDFRELQLSTEYVGPENWNAENPTVQKFWAIIHDLTFEEKQKFLLFVTGSSKAPLGGLKNIHLRIQRMGPHTNMLPTAHTCFNTLLLPEYDCDALVEEEEEPAAAASAGTTVAATEEGAPQPAEPTVSTPAQAGGDEGEQGAGANTEDSHMSVVGSEDGASAEGPATESAAIVGEADQQSALAESPGRPAPAPERADRASTAEDHPAGETTTAQQPSSAPTPSASSPPSPSRRKRRAGPPGVTTEQFMRERILKAISECEGFGLK